MKINKLLVLVLALSLCITGVTVLAHSNKSNIETREEVTYEAFAKHHHSKHIVYTESVLDHEANLITSQYEVWFNENGEYRMNTLSGPLEGDFEVWDGKEVYQYTKVINDLFIRELVSDEPTFVVPHRIFDTNIIFEIKKDIEERKLIRKNENEQIYTKVDADNKTETKISFDPDQEILLESSFISDSKVFHSIKVDSIEDIKEFNNSLLMVDTNDANITRIQQ